MSSFDLSVRFFLQMAFILGACRGVGWVFARLGQSQVVSEMIAGVLMGPSLPWLAEWRQFGVDYLAGVKVLDADKASQIVREGGGVRLFGEGVGYAIADLSSLS